MTIHDKIVFSEGRFSDKFLFWLWIFLKWWGSLRSDYPIFLNGGTHCDRITLRLFRVTGMNSVLLDGRQPMSDGVLGQFRQAIEADLLHDLTAKGMYGFVVDLQCQGNLLGGTTLG